MEAVVITPVEVLFFLLYFILGFTLYAAMFTVVGAVCSTEQDAQQLQNIVMLPLVIPAMLMFLIIINPASTLATVLSLIPPFVPMLMLCRIIVSEPPACASCIRFKESVSGAVGAAGLAGGAEHRPAPRLDLGRDLFQRPRLPRRHPHVRQTAEHPRDHPLVEVRVIARCGAPPLAERS